MKNKKLNQWLWKWHFIAGIISLPFVLVLAITGGIYLFKDEVEIPLRSKYKEIKSVDNPKISFQKQFELVNSNLQKQPDGLVIPKTTTEATEFVTGRFSHKKSIYITTDIVIYRQAATAEPRHGNK